MTDDLLSLAADAVAEARRRGADTADAVSVDRRGTELDLRDGRIEKLEQAEAREIGLRAFVGRSSAMISGSVLTKAAITRLAETAVAMAKLAPPDPYAGIAAPEELATSFPDLDLAAGELPGPDELKAMALEVESAAMAIAGVSKSGGASASASDRSLGLVTSSGFAHGYRRTGVSVSVSAIAGDGTAMERDYDYSAALHPGDLRPLGEIGEEAGRRAVRRLNPRKLKSQAVPVIFDRRVASSLLGHLAGAISGAAIARGTSFLKECLGQPVFSSAITIVDDPFRRRGLGSRPFDGEGLAGSRSNVIDAGILTGWLLDLRSARQLGLKPVGQGSRGLSSPPGPTSSNLYLESGNSTVRDLFRQADRGLYVTELIGSGVNMVTGDYSRRGIRLLDRGWRGRLPGQRDHHRRPAAGHVPRPGCRRRSGIPGGHERPIVPG